ncbi:MAG TPA: selenocysteine-specific translation elongation factor [Candidatus Polarisedimenticolia bacterium]|nr:selenocysteine-specific translation elongation factor [Candidatus Polarisedimenticolia bacterium]
MSTTRQIVVGTAGHIDHGKSRLVCALTGVDPDRLKEEKERGITIDIGFASLALDDGTRFGFVDVPGHERFVKNMLAGVGGIDLVLLVIAADESIKPQTREHFDICRLLQIPRGIIVLTKIDLVDPDLLDLVRLEAREFVAGSFLDSSPIAAVSSRTGAGLSELKDLLRQVADDVPSRAPSGPVRLPIDRSFSIKGFGTVVTGTLIAGTITGGDELEILPQGITARVRGLEVFNRTTHTASPGQRTAVNLQGVEAGSIERGDLLTSPGLLRPSHLLDVILEVLPQVSAPLKDLARVRFHHGTLEAMARVKLLESGAIPPGGRAFAQLRLEKPVTALPGDRFIVRRYSPALTIGGGSILHNHPPKLRPSDAGARDRLLRLAEPSVAARLRVLVDESRAEGLDDRTVMSLAGLDPDQTRAPLDEAVREGWLVSLESSPRRYLSRAIYQDLVQCVVLALEEFHRREPLKEGLPREELRTRLFTRSHPEVFRCLLADLAGQGRIRTEKDRVALATHRISLSPEESALMERIESRFASGGVNPPDLEAIVTDLKADPRQAGKLLHLLLARGRLVRIHDGKVFHAAALETLKRRLWDRRPQSPTIEISEFKDLSGTSRKNAIPLLEHFDQVRVTRREGNRRLILPPPSPAATN